MIAEDETTETAEDETAETEDKDSLRDVLETAFDDSEGSDDDTPISTDKTENEEEIAPVPGARAEGGVDGAEKPEIEIGQESASASGGTDTVRVAPVSWTPTSREHWAELPDELKSQILKRETEISQTLQTSAAARKGYDRYEQILQPYQAVIAAEGAQDGYAAVESLLKTASTLRLGTPEQKAQRIAGLLNAYNIDVNTLDTVLSDQIQGRETQPSQNAQLEALLDQRLRPINDMLSQYQNRDSQALTSELTTFEQDKEFINDVRMDMADMLDMAAKRGQVLSLDDAYNKACNFHPEISKVLTARQQQGQIASHNATTSAKKHAASSVSGRRVGTPATGMPEDLRGTIEAAWSEYDTPARI